ncbi:NAD(P)/FAD-dependent oxidoreductase [Luteococcus sp. OSA5]|uniref:NAD(P)/FAD-dependent oxidoreductase n=1 Tax=Luteococcus sp. OSA5 TaxID=3401630 RepID=UPI003B435392
MTGLLIIGASQAGVQLATSLRGLGDERPITLLGDEDHRPYQRPALSKEFLQGTMDKEQLIFRTQQFWDEHRITVVKGERVVRIDRQDDGSGVAIAASGAEFPFSQLALAVGARARQLEVPGADLDGVLALRNADDALDLKARAGKVTDVVVVGGGFIGLEAARSLHSMGKTVTVLEYGERLVGRAVGTETSDYFLEAHRQAGLDIRLGARIESVEGTDGRVTGVQLADGEVIAAQLVLVGIGVIPNTELAEELGLEVDNGIVVDTHGICSDGHTIAIGDVANIPNPTPGAPADERIRLESVNNAVEHAKVAAWWLAGQPEQYRGIPWFWSNQGDLKLQIAGLSMGHDQTVLRQDPAADKFSVLYYRAGRIIAADCINSPVDFMAVRGALTRGHDIPSDQAGDIDVPLKSLIRKEDS